MARRKRISYPRFVGIRFRERVDELGSTAAARGVAVSPSTIRRWYRQRKNFTDDQIESAKRILPDFTLRDRLAREVAQLGLVRAASLGNVPVSTLGGWVRRPSVPLVSMDYAERVLKDIRANKRGYTDRDLVRISVWACAAGTESISDDILTPDKINSIITFVFSGTGRRPSVVAKTKIELLADKFYRYVGARLEDTQAEKLQNAADRVFEPHKSEFGGVEQIERYSLVWAQELNAAIDANEILVDTLAPFDRPGAKVIVSERKAFVSDFGMAWDQAFVYMDRLSGKPFGIFYEKQDDGYTRTHIFERES